MEAQKQAFSQNKNKVLKYFFALAPAVIIYIYRSWFIYADRLCFGAILLFGITVAFIVSLSLLKNYSILSFCVVTIFVSFFIPRPIPEKIHLFLHRSEYEAVVELARNHQLGHKGDCQYAYVLPDEYSNLSYSKNNCIFVEYEPAFVVEFEPLFSRRLLVYAETPEAIEEYISCGGSDGLGYSQIEENWYRCVQDWN